MFPMPLAPFEQYFLYNDSPACPSEFFVHLEFQGRFDAGRAARALQAASDVHWMTRNRVRLDSRGRPVWEPLHGSPTVERLEEPVGHRLAISPIDIFSEFPIKLYWYLADNAGSLLFQVHHCALDGVGFFQFFELWWRVYQNPHSNLNQDQVNSGELVHRCRPRLKFLERVRLLPGQSRSIRAAIQLLNRTTVSLRSPSPPLTAPSRPAPLNFLSTRLSSTESDALRDFARAEGSTVNNLLLTTLFGTLLRWQTEPGQSLDGSHFRIMVPINERNELTRQMPACNHCTIISVDRTASHIQDRGELHRGIRRQMRIIKDWKLSLNFWRGLEICKWLPGGLERRVAESDVTATMLLTNLGNLSRYVTPPDAGAIRLTEDGLPVWTNAGVIPTLDEGMAAAIAIHFVNQRLGLTLHYDDSRLHSRDADRLLEWYLADIRQVFESKSWPRRSAEGLVRDGN